MIQFTNLELQMPKFGDPRKMSLPLLCVMDSVAARFAKVVINCGYEDEGHAGKSYHNRYGIGGACDFVINSDKTLDEEFLELKTYLDGLNTPYRLGVYPYWNNPGFHLDLAEGKADKEDPHKSMFWIRNKKGEYKYYFDFAKCLVDLKMELPK